MTQKPGSPIRGQSDGSVMTEVKRRGVNLAETWRGRNKKMLDWYRTIRLDNYLARPNLESFITNEPKAAYNLAVQILSTASVPVVIDKEGLDVTAATRVQRLEAMTRKIWRVVDRQNKYSGHKSWMREFVSMMLYSGWYSVFSGVDGRAAWATIWNPYEVYPKWDDELGLVECAHIYWTVAGDYDRKARMRNWDFQSGRHPQEPLQIIDYWQVDDNFQVSNTLLAGDKPVHVNRVFEEFHGKIPIRVAPVGGMPDRGSLPGNNNGRWTERIGESIVAANEDVLRNFNRQMTYVQQMIRDTANPRWFERTSGDPILNSDEIFKRGAIFRGGLNDSIEALQVGAVPVEASTITRDTQDMLAAASFSKTAAGVVNQPIYALMMSQIFQTSQHVLGPFIEGIQDALNFVNEDWYRQMKGMKLHPYDFSINWSQIPDHLLFDVQVHPRIPGDLVNRATVGRMLNPTFELSHEQIRTFLYPEISDPLRETARIRADRALRHPVSDDIALIEAYEDQAEALIASGDPAAANRYLTAAKTIESTIGQRNGPQEQAPQSNATIPASLTDSGV